MFAKTAVCAKCGKEFTYDGKTNKRKYCQGCAPSKPKEKPKAKAVNERLDAKVRAAHRLGISFGEWVTLFEGR